MQKKVFLWTAGLLIALATAAQQPDYLNKGVLLDGKTMVKTSVTSPFLGTFGFSGERILNKRLSAVLGVSFMPSTTLPFVVNIMDAAGTDKETSDMISSVKFNTFSFSPELRIYTGKGYGRGFYVSPYYRYERFGLNNFSVEFTASEKEEEFMLEGGLNTHSAGLMIGYQWLVGKKRNIVIDWTMLGAHYGVCTGNFHGKYSGALTEEERQEAQQSIDETFNDLPFIKAKGTVNNDNTADVSVKGPWAFLRGSVSVGIRF